MPVTIAEDPWKRSFAEIKQIYDVEIKLANQLRNSTKEERRNLYISLYDEFYSRFPQLRENTDEAIAWIVNQRMQLIQSFLQPNLTFLEVGPGDCAVSLEVAKHVKQVYAVDVSDEVTNQLSFPSNFELVISDGCKKSY